MWFPMKWQSLPSASNTGPRQQGVPKEPAVAFADLDCDRMLCRNCLAQRADRCRIGVGSLQIATITPDNLVDRKAREIGESAVRKTIGLFGRVGSVRTVAMPDASMRAKTSTCAVVWMSSSDLVELLRQAGS